MLQAPLCAVIPVLHMCPVRTRDVLLPLRPGLPPHPGCLIPPPQGRPYRALIGDTEGATLPARGALVEEQGEADFVVELATAVGAAAAGLASAPSSASLASSASVQWLDNPLASASPRP